MKSIFYYLFILLVCIGFKAQSQVTYSTSAIELPATPGGYYVINSGSSATVTSTVSVRLLPGVQLKSGSNVRINIDAPAPLPPLQYVNGYNWVQSRTFDENGVEIGASKQFYDYTGNETQSQVKNETANQVLATQRLYDFRGRPVASTLPAPIGSSQFIYKDGFVTNGGLNYNYLNFDGDPLNGSNPYAKLNNPDAVDNSAAGTLGWYYSNNNSLEPLVAATGLPYSRVDFLEDGTGGVKRGAGIGEQLKMGSTHETSTNSFPVKDELTKYLEIRNQFFPSAIVGASPTVLTGSAVQSVSNDEDGTAGMVVADISGKTLMTGRADDTGWLTVTNAINLTNIKPEYVFKLEPYLASRIASAVIDKFTITSANTVNIFCTTCSTPTSPIYTGKGSDYVHSGTNYDTYVVTSALPFAVSQVVKNIDVTVTAYDEAQSEYRTPDDNPIHYFRLNKATLVTITGNYDLYNVNDNATTAISFTSGGSLPAGYYKVVAKTSADYFTPNNVTVSYVNKYSDLTFNYYNQLGQLIGSIAPNGVQSLLLNGYTGLTTAAQLPFVSLCQYDVQGRLTSSTSPDAGTSNFIYRADGKIRFSQNAEQIVAANAGTGMQEKFSYTNYDNLGRPVESGELAVASAGTFATLASNSTALEAIDGTYGLPTGTKLSQINSYYDVAVPSLPIAGYIQDEGFLKGAVSYTTGSINGTVNSSTWYNYDSQGRVIWVLKQLSGLGAKSVDYSYNVQGNVTKVDYQKGSPAERFVHLYDYDADGRLINVKTNRDNSSTWLQQAKYTYYLHGPLKRTELAGQLQGIDYTYTPQGWLKSINGPTGDATKDPRQDGVANSFAKDAFGMQLEYFPGDYARSGVNIGNVTTGERTYYSGNVNGLSWQSNKPSSVLSIPGNANIQDPSMYTYNYDDKYQLKNAKYGTPNFTVSTFAVGTDRNENISGYDANGNITGLQRVERFGAVKNYSSYQYQAGTNKLLSVGNISNPTDYASYTYDEIGRLKSEIKTGATFNYYLKYEVTGKIIGVYADAALTNLKIGYTYDESGNRITSTDYTGTPMTTYYVYDAAGNVLAMYNGTTISEIPVYGADRLGTYTVTGNNYVYELRDNVGSVRVVLNRTLNGLGQADVITFKDYFPFGKVAFGPDNDYRYGYQGAYAEKDQITGWNNFDLRMYDGEIGRWLSIDPMGQYDSPYNGMGNNPVQGIDPTGGYSHLGAMWRHAITRGAGNIYQNEHGDWGFNTNKGETITSHFGSGAKSSSATHQYDEQVTKSLTIPVGSYNPPGPYLGPDPTKIATGRAGTPWIDPIDFLPGMAVGGMKALMAFRASPNLWRVGAYSEIRGVEAGLQAHHVGQQSLMKRLVPGYNPATAPSILVPELGHVTNMPQIGRVAATRGSGVFTTARQVLARDIMELRRVYGPQGIPNSALEELIQLNKTMYPEAFLR
jgi:RHS repeat-associated protein